MTTRVAFVCVQNAGRSQMAAVLAERMVAERGLDVAVLTGGTRPADAVHEGVVAAMDEIGIDVGDREPRAIAPDELAEADVVVTMGCGADDVCPATWSGDSRDWDLDDPDGEPPERVRAIRDGIADRVGALLDEVAATASTDEAG